MDAFSITSGFRALGCHVSDYIAEKLSCQAVEGFAELISCAGIEGGERVATFAEGSPREWFLPLSAEGPLVWKTAEVGESALPNVAFTLGIGFGNGSPMPQQTGQWDIYVNDRLAVSVRVVKHSQLWRGEQCSLAFAAHRIESAEPWGSLQLSDVLTNESFAAFGPAMLIVPRTWLHAGRRPVIRVQANAREPSTRWFQLTSLARMISDTDMFDVVDVALGRRLTVGGKNVYFGDIHTHSGQVRERHVGGCGTGSREENYNYALGPAGLDFYCLSDHEGQVDPDRIEEFFALADRYNADDRFVCLRGFEFTSLVYGHRNIYFRGAGGTIVNSCHNWDTLTFDPALATTPADLWQALEALDEPFLSVPHHSSTTSHPFNWDMFNPTHERLVEVYSCWGSSMYYGDFPRGVSDRYRSLDVRDALRRGFRVGFIASGDGHDGQPGNAQSPMSKHFFRHGGSGWAAVMCDRLTREDVFDALYDRRCYATTGVPIRLSVEMAGARMGSEIPAITGSGRPVLAVACHGCNGIDHIRIVKNGRVVHTQPIHGEWSAELEWADDNYTPNAPSYYYVRAVQVDRESAWSSPIWVG